MKAETSCQKTLEAFFGHTTFRPNQERIVEDLLAGRDVLAVMATGGGKSICYQLPAVLLGGTTVVVSPLIALMKDQVDDMNRQGISAALLTSNQTYDQRKAVEAELTDGSITILYVSPERLALPAFQDLLRRINPKLFAIDEAHCISQWGHQFRKDYRSLSLIRDLFPKTPIIALTATATEEVRDDIITQLHLRSPKRYVGGFDRENIAYTAINEKRESERIRLLALLISRHYKKAGIVYCRSRKAADEIAHELRRRDIRALAYHAGLSGNDRSRTQDSFLKGRTDIICATVAFGMGIDKPDVRFVVHFHPPKDIESFYQESGRAGRDGKPAESLLFYSKQDFAISKKLIDKEYTSHTDLSIRINKLSTMQAWCESAGCRRRSLLDVFGEEYPAMSCGNCDICRSATMSLEDRITKGIESISGRFGIDTAAAILTGSSKTAAHASLPAFGIATEWTGDEVKNAIHALIRDKKLMLSKNMRVKTQLKKKRLG
ncbi:RecQ family ATP-dependent DNA helicase [Methanocalculus sp. MC3]